ncbi:hypothetical protein GGR50DRAFT_300322 [Xylaria sp. CBS 124048]|nr:hypothetical protein GGR50DRAFT_300322 [Xylaria sp. CBS 124048]
MASEPPPNPPTPSSSSDSTPQRPRRTLPVDKYNNTNPLIHTIALGTTPLALISLCLPPRRFDLRAIMLGGVALWGTNQLTHDYGGRSLVARFSGLMASISGVQLSEKAKETQARIRWEKAQRAKLRELREEGLRSEPVVSTPESTRQEAEGEKKGVLEKLWMGDAAPDWKEKRDQREKEALKEGGIGYWGLIAEQVMEVWSGGKKEEERKGEVGEDGTKSDKNTKDR